MAKTTIGIFKTFKSRKAQSAPRRIPDRVLMKDAIRSYADRALSNEPDLSPRLLLRMEKATADLVKEGRMQETPEGLAALAKQYKDTPIKTVPSDRLWIRREDGTLIPVPVEKDDVSPRVRAFQSWQSMRQRGTTEFNYIVLEDEPYSKVSLYFSGLSFFFYKEDFAFGFADVSIMYKGRDIAMMVYKNGTVVYPVGDRRKIETRD